jgi:hypothetical protein
MSEQGDYKRERYTSEQEHYKRERCCKRELMRRYVQKIRLTESALKM